MKKSSMLFALMGVLCIGNAFAEDAVPTVAVVSPATKPIDISEKPQNMDKMRLVYKGQTYVCPARCTYVRDPEGPGGYAVPPQCENRQTGEACRVNVFTNINVSDNQVAAEDTMLDVELIDATPNVVVPQKVDAPVKAQRKLDVSRAGKLKTTTTVKPTPVNPTPVAQDKLSDGGDVVAINYPAGCTPDCAILGNVVLCECKSSDGKNCKAEVVTSDSTSQLR